MVDRLLLVPMGWAVGSLDVFDWVGARQLWQKPMETWHFVFTGQGLALFPFHCSFRAETSPISVKKKREDVGG